MRRTGAICNVAPQPTVCSVGRAAASGRRKARGSALHPVCFHRALPRAQDAPVFVPKPKDSQSVSEGPGAGHQLASLRLCTLRAAIFFFLQALQGSADCKCSLMFHQIPRNQPHQAGQSPALSGLWFPFASCFFMSFFHCSKSGWVGFFFCMSLPTSMSFSWCSPETLSTVGGAQACIVLLSCVAVALGQLCWLYLWREE